MFSLLGSISAIFVGRFSDFLPNFISGLIIITIGIVLSVVLKNFLHSLFRFFRLEALLDSSKLMKSYEVHIWETIFAEITRWATIIVFLIPAFDIWGLSRVISVLSQVLIYTPNLIIGLLIGFFGLITANLLSEVVAHSLRGKKESYVRGMALLTKGVIVFFTVLIFLNQIGIAQDLIKILFTGIVAMIALAGGLAFGLGGRDAAAELIEEVMKKWRDR